MKSSEVFWNVVASYHGKYIHVEIAMILVGILLTILLYRKPSLLLSSMMKVFLAFSFAFQSFAFFWGLDGSPIGRYLAGPLFLAIALLFLIDLWIGKIVFTYPTERVNRIPIFVLWGFVLFGYPAISYLFGHRYPAITLPFMPCPLTVFALSLMAAALPRVDYKVYVLLLVWAALGLPKVFGLFDVREDTILFLAGVYALIMLIKNFRKKTLHL